MATLAPPSPDRGSQDPEPTPDDPRGTGLPGRPAGMVLLIGVVGLLVAAVLNADALVRDAENKPFGASRDRALSVWQPVQDLSELLRLDVPRRLADEALGRDLDADVLELPPVEVVAGPAADGGTAAEDPAGSGTNTGSAPEPGSGAGTESADDAVEPVGAEGPWAAIVPEIDADPTPSTATTPTTPPGPLLRQPTVDEPLRIQVAGDSIADVLGQQLIRAASDLSLVEAQVDSRISTGLARPDFFDWPARLLQIATDDDPDVLVLMFGANDDQGLRKPDGEVVVLGSDGWRTEYARRVAGVMDLVERPARVVVWIGEPAMDREPLNTHVGTMAEVARVQATTRDHVIYIDAAEVLGTPDRVYASRAEPDGPRLRAADGIHLSSAGGERLADAVMDRVAELVDLTPPPPPTTVAPTTVAPTTPPTPEESTTPPTTVAPTTDAPTTAPTTDAPVTVPTTEAPTTVAPTTAPTTTP